MVRRLAGISSFAVALLLGAGSAHATRVWGEGQSPYGDVLSNAARISVDEDAPITIGRDADGTVVVRDGAPQPRLDAGGTCASVDAATVRCPASTTTATVVPEPFDSPAPLRVVVQDGAALRVAVFAGAGDDVIDVRGASAGQVSCGAGLDVVQAPFPRVWGDCEQVNGMPPHPARAMLGTVSPGEVDAAPGGIAWVDGRGRLHLRTALAGPERVLRPRRSTAFRDLDVGVDRRGRPVATAAECRGATGCGRWLSVDVRTGRRAPLHVPAPPGCTVATVARWRKRTALGVRCRKPITTNVVVTGSGPPRRFALAYPGFRHPSVDIRGDLVGASFLDVDDALWALRIGSRPCRVQIGGGSEGPWGWSHAGRARIVAGDRMLWAGSQGSGDFDQGHGTLTSVDPRCRTGERYVLEEAPMTVVGSALVLAIGDRLAAQPLVTVPPPLYPVASPAQAIGVE